MNPWKLHDDSCESSWVIASTNQPTRKHANSQTNATENITFSTLSAKEVSVYISIDVSERGTHSYLGSPITNINSIQALIVRKRPSLLAFWPSTVLHCTWTGIGAMQLYATEPFTFTNQSRLNLAAELLYSARLIFSITFQQVRLQY